jgi:hypothetical protein
MARKFECDGCGIDARADGDGNIPQTWRKFMMKVEGGQNVIPAFHAFDLCNSCTSTFQGMFPSNWPHAKPASEAA